MTTVRCASRCESVTARSRASGRVKSGACAPSLIFFFKQKTAYEFQRRLKIWEPRRACILGSGTIGLLMALAARLRGLELSVFSLPQKPYRNADLVEKLGGVYLSSAELTLAEASEQRGPFDLIMDASGFSP